MKETGYTIKQEGKTFAAYEHRKVVSKGCITKEDALHSIWVANGSDKSKFYEMVHDVVICRTLHVRKDDR